MKNKTKINKNDRFGKLSILKEVQPYLSPGGQKCRKFLCQCDCGKEKEVVLRSLKKGTTKSCGCIVLKGLRTTHGDTYKNFYRRYWGILNRCNNHKDRNYPNYGGRGIKCEWGSYESFKKDMLKGYKKELTIDRINNDGNYCKENCRWVNYKIQNRNYSKNVKYKGECAKDASLRLKGSEGLVHARLRLGWSLEEAFTKKVGPQGK